MTSRAAPLIRLLKPAIGVALLAWLLSQLEWAELKRLSERPDPERFWLGTALLLLSFSLMQPLRLHSLLRRYTGGLSGSYRLFAVGALFNNLLPSNVGGDAVRLLYLVRVTPGNWGAPLALLLLQRISQLLVLLVVAAACAALDLPRLTSLLADRGSLEGGSAWWPVIATLGLGLLSAAALAHSRVGRRVLGRVRLLVEQAREGIAALSTPVILELLLLTVGFHLLRVAAFDLLCRYLGYPLGWSDIVLVLALTAVAALLPITVGGLGVMEGAIVGGLMLFGVSHPAAVAIALVNRGTLLPPAIAGGVVYALDRDRLAQSRASVEKAPSA